jgi:hypothetical protein
MKGLSSLERVILESIGSGSLTHEAIKNMSGLHANVCFNVLQALVIRGIISTNGIQYQIAKNISPLLMEEINGVEAKHAESLEMIEAVIDQKSDRTFRFQKIALEAKDEKIFLAMLSNLESFLHDAHKKAQASTPLKERKVIFWGMGEVQKLLGQLLEERL